MDRFHLKTQRPSGFYDIAEDVEEDDAYLDDVEIETFSSGEDDTWNDFDVAISKGEKLHKASQSFTSTRTYVPPKRIGPRNLIKSDTELRRASHETGRNENQRNWRTSLNNGKIHPVRGVNVANKARKDIEIKQRVFIGCENNVQQQADNEVISREDVDNTRKHLPTIEELTDRLRQYSSTSRKSPEFQDIMETQSNCSSESDMCGQFDKHNSYEQEPETSPNLGHEHIAEGLRTSASSVASDESDRISSALLHTLKPATGRTTLVSLRAVISSGEFLIRDSVTPSDIALVAMGELDETNQFSVPPLDTEPHDDSCQESCVSSHTMCNNLGPDFQFLERFKLKDLHKTTVRSTVCMDKVRLNPTTDSILAPYLRYAPMLDESTTPHNPLRFLPEWQPILFPVRPPVQITVNNNNTHHTFPRVQDSRYTSQNISSDSFSCLTNVLEQKTIVKKIIQK